jgi:hypothetical protein
MATRHVDDSTIHHLWPFLLERRSDATQRPSLYVFEQIDPDHEYLSCISAAAIDHEDTWTQDPREHDWATELRKVDACKDLFAKNAGNHEWLWEFLRRLPAAQSVPKELCLGSDLAHSLIGTLSGEQLGGNHLLEPIAKGGFGTIYDAVNPKG